MSNRLQAGLDIHQKQNVAISFSIALSYARPVCCRP